jgi:hypothetical protein
MIKMNLHHEYLVIEDSGFLIDKKSFHLVGIFLFINYLFQTLLGSSKSICISFPGQPKVIQIQIQVESLLAALFKIPLGKAFA